MGDGTQRKSYLYIEDCLDAITSVIRQRTALRAKHRVEVYNLGTVEYIDVNQSIRVICSALGVSPEIEYSGGNRGWVGDNPFIFLDTQKIQSTGWKAKLSIQEGVNRTLKWLRDNPWALERR